MALFTVLPKEKRVLVHFTNGYLCEMSLILKNELFFAEFTSNSEAYRVFVDFSQKREG